MEYDDPAFRRGRLFVAALRHDSIVAPWVIDGPINGSIFQTYVEQVLVPTLRTGDILASGQ